VRSDLGQPFDSFVRAIGRCWPVRPCAAGRERVRDVIVEPRTLPGTIGPA